MLPESDQIIPSYFLLREIGEGGMGTVYSARHRSEDYARKQGEVAIKVLDRKQAKRPDICERFEREAMLLKDLDHPGIVRGHDLIYLEKSRALVMDLIDGRTLDQVIGTETGPIPWERAREIFTPLCDAVAYLHEQSVIHRDLKPDNVMLTPDDRPVLLDLGIAKQLAGGNTQTGTGMGTVAYMAPEQYVDAKAVDARSDVYALGMTLYEMLAGRLPWESGTTDFSILKLKESGALPPPTTHCPDIPPRVVAAVMAATAVDPDERPRSISDLQRLLTAPKKRQTLVLPPAALPGPAAAPIAAASDAPAPAPAPAPTPAVTRHEPAPSPPPGKSKAPMLAIAGLLGLGVVGGVVMLGLPVPGVGEILSLGVVGGVVMLGLRRHRRIQRRSESKAPMPAIVGLVGMGVVGGVGMLGIYDNWTVIDVPVGYEAGYTQRVTVQGVTFELAYAPAGTFIMGSPTGMRRAGRQDDETQHTVTLTQGFHIGTTEVTQALYKAVMGDNPSSNGHYHHDTHPVEQVSWFDAVAFCNALSELEDLELAYNISGQTVTMNEGASGYRLPTEAEWEYTARAGESHTYAGSNPVDAVAWTFRNSDGQIHPVGSKKANAWGLHDMSGNVWEWTGDWKGDYPTGSVTDPQGASTGDYRVIRGGAFSNSSDKARVANRGGHYPYSALDNLGFRVVLPE
jgi:formylglycine-generating enzyme required for sulfatase activity/tRNA A-37 threonylcarbamoyl transferase component Bud32